MLTRAQTDAIREHVALDTHINRLIRLARTDLYEGPAQLVVDEDDHEPYPGFVAACEMIREAIPRSDLYLDVEIDEVIGDVEPHWHGCECGCEPDDPDAPVGYYPESVLHVDQRDVVRMLVGRELSEYVL
jgi:hypothetical protein